MPVLDELAPADVRQVLSTYRDALRAHQEELNRLNVYPVPDGDTGTNMALTVESVLEELAGAPDAMPAVCAAIAHGSLMGARGNSGVILSQILRGLSDTFAAREAVRAPDVVAGLRRGADAAYGAVLRPVEGTILTVVRETAEAAERAAAAGAVGLDQLLEQAVAAAHAAVEHTPDQLPVLREAGVVDAGGRGFELFVHSCRSVVSGRPVPVPEVVATPAAVEAHLHRDAAGPRYEVMYLLHAPDDRVGELTGAWDGLGDSVVVVGGDGLWNCHVHTDDIGAAIEAGIAIGRPERIRVTDLVEQVGEVEEASWVREHTANPSSVTPVATAVVAVAVGDGLRRLFTGLGVQHVVAGGQSMNPSTAQILEAVERCTADAVVVLPNNHNVVPVAQQVPDLTDRPVGVVPTGAVVEALAAMVAYDADAPLAANLASMAEAAGRVRAGEVTQAVRDTTAECGRIARGDWIAITAAGVCAATPTAVDAAVALVDALVDADSELVTVITGADAVADDTLRISEHVGRTHPHVEIELHEGDQPLYPYLVGVE